MDILAVDRKNGSYPVEEARARFTQYGLCVLRGYLPPETQEPMRWAVEQRLAKAAQRSQILRFKQWPAAEFLLGDVLAVRELEPFGNVFFTPDCIGLVKALLDTGELMYWGDSSIQVGAAARGFHKDNVDRSDGRQDDWRRPYELVRCGFYFQDHTRHSGGLKVRLGSHEAPDHLTGRMRDLSTKYGDLVIWNMRLTHSGNARKLRWLRGIPLHPRLEARMPDALCATEQSRRMASFCAFGKPGSQLDRYIDKMNARSDDYKPYFQFARKATEAVPIMARSGVTFRAPNSYYGELD